MTVIVAVRDRMLSDSICTSGDSHFPTEKIYRHKGELIGVAGDNHHIERFLRWYTSGRKKPLDVDDKSEFSVIVLNRRGIWDYSGSSLADKVLRDFHGCGVGWPATHAAMLAGADPRKAIEITCQVTHLCGLPVQEHKL